MEVAREIQASPDLAGKLGGAVTFLTRSSECGRGRPGEGERDPRGGLARPQVEVLELATSELAEVRWHVGLLVPRLRISVDQVAMAVGVLEKLLDDPSRIVQCNALGGIVCLSHQHQDLTDRPAPL